MRTIIFGLPKTGTTGLYGLVKNGMQNAGLNPICSFEPPGVGGYKGFFSHALPDASLLSKAMIRKAYFEEPEVIQAFSHRVMIVRDPRDRAISRMLFRALGKRLDDEGALNQFVDVLRAKEADPSSISFKQITEKADELGIGKSEWKGIKGRMKFQAEVIKEFDFLAYHYEAFVEGHYFQLANYLGLDLENANASNTSWLNHISRSKSSGEWRNWFTAEDIDFIRPIFKPYMDEFGYEDNWDLAKNPKVNPKTASQYVLDKYAKRKAEFSFMDSDGSTGINTEAELEFYKGRAEDGRPADIMRMAEYAVSMKDTASAVDWFERGHLLGNSKATNKLKQLVEKGVRPAHPRSSLVAQTAAAS